MERKATKRVTKKRETSVECVHKYHQWVMENQTVEKVCREKQRDERMAESGYSPLLRFLAFFFCCIWRSAVKIKRRDEKRKIWKCNAKEMKSNEDARKEYKMPDLNEKEDESRKRRTARVYKKKKEKNRDDVRKRK